jgi:hypothetical protein
VNINDPVWVQLTPFGQGLLLGHYNKFQTTGMPQVERMHSFHDGVWKFSLWELMQVFGSCMFNGAVEMPFVNNEVFFEKPEGAMP